MTFVSYPSTGHVEWLSDRAVRGDKLLRPEEVGTLLSGPVVVEEKIDGDNLGFSVVEGELRVQHRGDYVRPGSGYRYPYLDSWLASHEASLVPALNGELVLFGEWCSVVHAVEYDRLPDWMLAFDVFDRKSAAFWSAERRDRWCTALGIHVVPRVTAGRFEVSEIRALLGPSAVGPTAMEGVVVRKDSDGMNLLRGKLVRPGHVGIDEEHWRRRPMRLNGLAIPTDSHPRNPGTLLAPP